MSILKGFTGPIGAAGLSVLLVACGAPQDEDSTQAPADADAQVESEGLDSADTEMADMDTGAADDAEGFDSESYSTEEPAAVESEQAANCDGLPKDLIQSTVGQGQLVLNLSLAKGGNYKAIEETAGLPKPDSFRMLGNGFAAFDPTGIEAMPTFDSPEAIANDLIKTADLLEAALAAGENADDPAWGALSEFYTTSFFTKHNASIAYYAGQAGCTN